MELTRFIKLLYRSKYILISVPLITVIITYFLVQRLPDKFVSHGRIATGIVDKADLLVKSEESSEYKANQAFSNLIQMMLLKKIVDQVSYKLMLHDLTEDSVFREPGKLLTQLNPAARRHAIEVYTDKYETMQELSLWNADENGLYRVLASMGYDYETISGNIKIYRAGNSDFIDLEYESNNPRLSAFIINTLCSEFIRYYTTLVKENQLRAVNFLDSLLRQKQSALNNKMQDLKNYKIQNRVLNLYEQAKAVYLQISDFETRKELAKKDVASYTAALQSIDRKFDPADRKYLESALTDIHQKILSTQEQLKSLNSAYIQGNFEASYKPAIDSLQQQLTAQINQSSDKYIYSPLVAKENLINQKLSLEVTLELAQNSLGSLEDEIIRLNEKLDRLVPNEAVIQAYESDIDIAGREYIETLNKFNETSLQTSLSVKLRQMETAMPGMPGPSKKMFMLALAGILSFIFCVLVLFVIFYLDHSIREPKQMADATQFPVLGFLPLIDFHDSNPVRLWNNQTQSEGIQQFKNLLRSIRFEIENEINGNKIIAVTSLTEGEGKTFVTLNLAYAFSRMKKVLVIDGNFDHPGISEMINSKFFVDDFIKDDAVLTAAEKDYPVSFLGNAGDDISLYELSDRNVIENKIALLKTRFDLILIETPSLSSMNKAKEWIVFADRTVAVFEANQNITETKKLYLQYLGNLHEKFAGWIFNKARTIPSTKKRASNK